MTPLLLAGFCGVITAVAVVRNALAANVDPADRGTTLVAAGVTAMALGWASLKTGRTPAASVFLVVGIGACSVGFVTIRRHL